MTRAESPDDGLAFDFLAPDAPPPGHPAGPLMTGHANGLITLSLAEADDVERERQRTQIGEPYRALLGHFRHEIAHYYWDCLIANSPSIDEFRKLFGDERQDYGAALQRHSGTGRRRLARALRHRICQLASMGGFCRDLGAFFHMVDTLGNRTRVRAGA